MNNQDRRGIYYFLPKESIVTVEEKDATLEQLTEVICNLSFDNPSARVNYRLELIPENIQNIEINN